MTLSYQIDVKGPLNQLLSDSWVTTKRNIIKLRRDPEIFVFTLIQPIMFVLLFNYVFAGAISIEGGD